MLAELTNCIARKADYHADATEAVYRLVNVVKGCATNLGATDVAGESASKTLQGGKLSTLMLHPLILLLCQ